MWVCVMAAHRVLWGGGVGLVRLRTSFFHFDYMTVGFYYSLWFHRADLSILGRRGFVVGCWGSIHV